METIQEIVKGLIIGETLGSSYEGMSRGHVDSHFRNEQGYPDNFEALKGHYDRWTKPGLYGSISQLFIVSALIGSERPCDYGSVHRFLSGKGRVLDETSGVFRAPGRLFEQYLISLYRGMDTTAVDDHMSATVLPVTAGGVLSMLPYACPSAAEIIAFSRSFHADIASSVGSALFAFLIHRILVSNDDSLIRMSVVEGKRLCDEIAQSQPALFKSGVNPDRCLESAVLFVEIFEALEVALSVDEAERIIVEKVNRIMKSPITRCTVDYPYTILPFAAAIVSLEGEQSLYTAARKGGSSSILAAITGMLAGALYKDPFPEELVDGLVNRKGVFDFIERIASGNAGIDDASEFFDKEITLTGKEREERNARLKHHKVPEQKKRTMADREAFLTKHVVESWTKADKAKWRRTRKTKGEDSDE